MVRIGDHATLQGAAGTSGQLAIYDGGERARSSVFGRDVSYLLALLGHDSRFSMLRPPEASQGGCTCWLLSDMTLIALASYCKADGSGALQIKHNYSPVFTGFLGSRTRYTISPSFMWPV